MIQTVPQTFEEKVKMYMKCSKLQLAEMLSNRDILDDTLSAFEDYNKTNPPTITTTTTGELIINTRFL